MKNKIKKTNKTPKKKSQKNLGVKSNNKMTMKLSKIITIFLMIFVILQPIMDTLTYLQIRYNFNLLSISSLFRTITFGLIILYLLVDKDKRKNIWFLLIYFVSGIIGSMFSCIFNTGWSLGASGAIFGLMGALCYFGYYYRLYMGKALYNEIIPVIVLNLALSIIVSNIEFYAHIGGLIGGVFITMGLGVKNKTDKQSSINGWITFAILFIFTLYMLFFR